MGKYLLKNLFCTRQHIEDLWLVTEYETHSIDASLIKRLADLFWIIQDFGNLCASLYHQKLFKYLIECNGLRTRYDRYLLTKIELFTVITCEYNIGITIYWVISQLMFLTELSLPFPRVNILCFFVKTCYSLNNDFYIW